MMRLAWRNAAIGWLPGAGSIRLTRVPTTPETLNMFDLRGSSRALTTIYIGSVATKACQHYPGPQHTRTLAVVRHDAPEEGKPPRWQVRASVPAETQRLAYRQARVPPGINLLAATVSATPPRNVRATALDLTFDIFGA